ncbi:NYN domain-containing protein [Aliivibrio salmonicida]|uniref:Uncharacterized protein n=1 Tax=Aliivibrio salmonicida (strain LFI1238) TaxID=316275 RepID=B6ENY1_ALISL|nr:NYN domain-containing protein [Aliivibrio salmonicida]AZL83641.1 NYN domain-containing protein [Aliivibrio salmonicida]CAQ77713.1 hypothetical protein VSAL_I0028 [Aliivibrio salmonicida LFI1238]
MRTRIYIDGYNFYYGCLKGTPYKWLDLVKLFEEHIIPRSDVYNATLHDNVGIKYFTAEITNKAAADPNSVNDQRSYHHALYLHSENLLKTIKGSYAVDKVEYPKVEYYEAGIEKEPKDCARVKVWKLEEKQSDVNIAIEAVYDAVMDHTLEQIIFVTNDTDIVPALEKIREHNQKSLRSPIKIGLVIPSKENNEYRKPNKSLSNLADWTVKYIKNSELSESQLPCRIAGRKSSAIKPTSWFKYNQKVEEILEILAASDVLKTIPRAWRWLSEPKPEVKDLPILTSTPDQLLDCEKDIEDVLEHVKAFALYMREKNKS